ncbi:hypothetical protein Lesp02_36740 [Lentzea sp. NBRC 105346]|uniref:hypothetical protein n=1 Tax=Lentzea sp. NBRC 105346 TaxID=3032205 RepID=UPI0024A4BACB|nr:hypothetical protein [Lentzea sp. NBRC 105346]GLZ31486.1 hypothetical protein Lesp02_36740 [Lentzea sp. NBRC 105346]
MTDIRTLLTSALDDEPPLGIDKARVIGRGRKRLHLRAWMGAAAVALVLAGGPVAYHAVDRPASWLPTALPPAPPTSDQHAAELTKVLDAANRPFTVVNKGDHYAGERTMVMESNPPITITLIVEVRWEVYRPCDDCEVIDLPDRRLVVHPSDGLRREVSAFLPDGTHIRVISTSDTPRVPPERVETLKTYASLPGLTF